VRIPFNYTQLYLPFLSSREKVGKEAESLLHRKVLKVIPVDDWCTTWAAGWTIMLRRTSKIVKEIVDNMCLSVVPRLSRSFWEGDVHTHLLL
jgi:hypothetical protein